MRREYSIEKIINGDYTHYEIKVTLCILRCKIPFGYVWEYYGSIEHGSNRRGHYKTVELAQDRIKELQTSRPKKIRIKI